MMRRRKRGEGCLEHLLLRHKTKAEVKSKPKPKTTISLFDDDEQDEEEDFLAAPVASKPNGYVLHSLDAILWVVWSYFLYLGVPGKKVSSGKQGLGREAPYLQVSLGFPLLALPIPYLAVSSQADKLCNPEYWQSELPAKKYKLWLRLSNQFL